MLQQGQASYVTDSGEKLFSVLSWAIGRILALGTRYQLLSMV